MINYTHVLTTLMEDIVRRVPPLNFIRMSDVLVFARFGRTGVGGAFATCHSLNLPTSDPGYYFWRNRTTGEVVRRSEWFVTKSPEVVLGRSQIKYLISFALPRFCDQVTSRSRKAVYYPGAEDWIAKLDTVVHELYHIDPRDAGLRQFETADGTYSPHTHGPGFYEQVAEMVMMYLASRPDPSTYDFLRYNFAELNERFDGVAGVTFRGFPSYPQRYTEIIDQQPGDPAVAVVPVKRPGRPTRYTEQDLQLRQFFATTARCVSPVHHRVRCWPRSGSLPVSMRPLERA